MEKTDSTVTELPTEQQLPVEVTIEDKPAQPVFTSPLSNSITNVKYDEMESNMWDNLVRFISV